MKTLTTVKEIKEEAKNDNRAAFLIQMNKEIVDWLLSIGGKNRDIVQTNLASWRDCVKIGDWSVDNCEMKVNSSCTWLIDGHHRTMAISLEHAYGLKAKMLVVPDENQEDIFKNQDCRGTRRNVGVQATLAGVNNAAVWLAVERAYRTFMSGDQTPSTVQSVERFLAQKESVINKIDTRRKFKNEDAQADASSTACLIIIAEKYPSRIADLNSIWDRVISGEMLNSSMPEYHLRSRIRNKKEVTKKDMVWLTMKALCASLEGFEIKTLKVFDSDIKRISSIFGIASNKNKGAKK